MKVAVISIAGGSGSGKTTVAEKLISSFKKKQVRLIRIDDYYKRLNMPFEERVKVNYDHPNAIDFDLLYDNINSLINGESVEKPIYDFTIHNRKDVTELIEPSQIILIEGIFALCDERIRNLSDIKIYVDTDGDIRFIRRLTRDIKERGRTVDNVVEQYLSTVKPMHDAFIEPTKKYADIIIPNDKSHNVGVNLIKLKINDFLENNE